jgi:hypothetical protein
MPETPLSHRELVRVANYACDLAKVREGGDDDLIDRAFNAACKQIWGYTLDDFDDECLSAQDHALLDRMTWKRACSFAVENGYDLFDYATNKIVTEWWGFTWMILAEKRRLLTPETRAATWARYAAKLRAKSNNVVGVIAGRR